MTVSVDNFFLFFHHEILKYVSTHVQIFRVPYRTRFGNNHGFIPRGPERAAKVFHTLQDQ